MLPPKAGSERNEYILDAIRNHRYDVKFKEITSQTPDGKHNARFSVFTDALKIDGIRINVSAALAQQIADLLGCSLPTAKLMDLTYMQRDVTLPPFPAAKIGVNLTAMDTTEAMIKESAKIDAALADKGNPQGIVNTVGKGWVLDNGMLDAFGKPKLLSGVPMAVNYGWAFEGTYDGQKFDPCASAPSSNVRVIQGRGYRHDCKHTDYSQMCLLVDRNCIIDGQAMDLLDVLSNPDLAKLAHHEGVLKVFRQPGTPGDPLPKLSPIASILSPLDSALTLLKDSTASKASSAKTVTNGTDVLKSSSSDIETPHDNHRKLGLGLIGLSAIGFTAWLLKK
jgi:hypothetical protein